MTKREVIKAIKFVTGSKEPLQIKIWKEGPTWKFEIDSDFADSGSRTGFFIASEGRKITLSEAGEYLSELFENNQHYLRKSIFMTYVVIKKRRKQMKTEKSTSGKTHKEYIVYPEEHKLSTIARTVRESINCKKGRGNK